VNPLREKARAGALFPERFKEGPMKKPAAIIMGLIAGVLLALGPACQSKTPVAQLKAYPADSADGVIDQANTAFDPAVSSDGKGSLKITAAGPVTVRLFETGDLDIENARLTYLAMVKAEDFEGKAYLEMWCRMPGGGEFFSRGLDRPALGPVDWTSLETPFFLKKGENPDNVSLNLVIEGKGVIWIDDIRLMSGPLE
jgi:hypothetical protein